MSQEEEEFPIARKALDEHIAILEEKLEWLEHDRDQIERLHDDKIESISVIKRELSKSKEKREKLLVEGHSVTTPYQSDN